VPRKKAEQKVGYRHPPKETQFRKGVSGNLHGRPKGSFNLGTVLERTARQMITINENGRRRTITKLEAAAMQISNKSAIGDLKAINLLFNLLRSAEVLTPDGREEPLLNADDNKVIANIMKRLGKAKGNN
jgi:hypothetical protein